MSELTTTRYTQVPYYIDAVEVTKENIEAVAKWCGGTMKVEDGGKKRPYIKVNVIRPHSNRQTMAFVGDFVLSSESGFKIYNPVAFARGWVPAPRVGEVEEEFSKAMQEALGSKEYHLTI